MELEALARAEKAGRAEAEGLRAALAGAEVVRKNLEEGSKRELEEVQRLHQEQVNVGAGGIQIHNRELGSGFPAKSRYRRRVPCEQWSKEKNISGLERRRTWVFWSYSDCTFFPRTQVTSHHLKPSFPSQ